MTLYRIALLLVASAAMLVPVGCGGGDATSTGSTGVVRTEAFHPRRDEGDRQGQQKDRAGDADGSPDSPDQGGERGQKSTTTGAEPRRVPIAPLEVAGGGSARYRVEGGDNSVQDYGEEAGETELREAAEAVHAFFVARVEGEWKRACSLLSTPTVHGFEELEAESPQLHGRGCPGVLAGLTESVSPSLARQLTRVDARALRRGGEQAFLIYTGPPGRTVYAMPLHREEGTWRLDAIGGDQLPGT